MISIFNTHGAIHSHQKFASKSVWAAGIAHLKGFVLENLLPGKIPPKPRTISAIQQ